MKQITKAMIRPYYLSEKPSKTLVNGGLEYDPTTFDSLKEKMLKSITHTFQKNGDLIIKAWNKKINFHFTSKILTPAYQGNLANCINLVKKFIDLNNFSTDILIHGLNVKVLPNKDTLITGLSPAPLDGFNNGIKLFINKKIIDPTKPIVKFTTKKELNNYVETLLHEYIHHLIFQFNSISTSGRNIYKNGSVLKETDKLNSKFKENVKEFFNNLKNKDAKSAWKTFFEIPANQKHTNYLKNNNPKVDKVENWFIDKKTLQNMKKYYGVGIFEQILNKPFKWMLKSMSEISYFYYDYNKPEMWPEITNFFLNKKVASSVEFFLRIWKESGLNFLDTTYGRVAENVMGAFLHHYVGINNKNGVRLWSETNNGEKYLNIDFSSIGKIETPNIKNVVITLKGKKYNIPIDHHQLPFGFRDQPSAQIRHKYIANTASGTIKVKILPSMPLNPNDFKNIDVKINLNNQQVLSNQDTIIDMYRMISTNNIFVFDQNIKKFIDIVDLI